MIIGDMNEVLHPSEVRGWDFLASRATRFAQTLEDCRMVDLGLVGGRFTWFRKVNNRIILSKRLYRALGDVDWRLAFLEAYVETLNRVSSYHCPLLMHCGVTPDANFNRSFRFLASWVDHPNYQIVVENAWQRGLNDIDKKLEQVRKDSITFNKEVFGNIFRRKRWVEGRL